MSPIKASPPLPSETAVGAVLGARAAPLKLTLKDSKGAIVFENDVVKDAAHRVEALLLQQPSEARHRIIDGVQRALAEQKTADLEYFKTALAQREKDLLNQVRPQRARIEAAEKGLAVLKELEAWSIEGRGARLERQTTSRAHILRAAIARSQIVHWTLLKDKTAQAFLAGIDAPPFGQVFLVEHDWAAAFKGAEEFEDRRQEFVLPYENVCFEFKLSGKNICAMASNAHASDHDVIAAVFVELKSSFPEAWLYIAADEQMWSPVLKSLGWQIKAICIALEAEVAISDVVRAPHRLNRARERAGKLPVFDYHVVKLACRSRLVALPDDERSVPGNKKRLHFRRGHWRHFETHKTWIKWMLVGDPDLGFVDKEYRL